MSVTFSWTRSPDELAKEIEKYGKRVEVAVAAVAGYVGQKMQNEARRGGSWEDRTGAARSGIFFAVDGLGVGTVVGELGPERAKALAAKTDVLVAQGSDSILILTLGHTVYYGKFLELAHGGRYAVIMSTIERNLPGLQKMLQDLFRG